MQNVNETERDSARTGLERFVGLEHLEPGSLHVRSWGNVADGTTFTRRCRPGQVLFGKRRAYQRKVAVAEFDAVVSGDIYVFAPKAGRLIPELLPFICLSKRFYEHAVGTSAGSLSPRTNWSSLAGFEFDLPPLEVQRRIAEVLWTLIELQETYLNAISRCNIWITSFVGELHSDAHISRIVLSSVIDAIIPGKSVSGVNEPIENGQYGVLKVSAVGPNGFDAQEHKRLIQQTDFLPQFAVCAGDFLITRCNTPQLVGRVCIVPDECPNLMLCDKTIKLVFSPEKVEPRFLEEVLKSRGVRQQIEKCASGTGGAMKNISQEDIRSIIVPLPELETQKELVRTIEIIKRIRIQFEIALGSSSRLSTEITNQALG
ncbi:MAG: restriction endonuclease subunit S [Methanospirillum sp.]